MAVTDAQIARGKELAAMPDVKFLQLWDKYKDYTPNELNAAEPFYVVVAIQKLRNRVEDE